MALGNPLIKDNEAVDYRGIQEIAVLLIVAVIT